ncbi:MAG: carboxymuconolactone decarboxylase family protein [Polaromonas sp.]|uniref:carboxymuconolactone decarboxylase family protein n=1 Tax=Polaromonas sp. TaxID=1869339 RepID=UPI00181DC526|nr:carboxymuconolactone decarboxylase family protein [Polaromonas sp.]NMM09541.1 carboxymuconolactone decarboxylase family protein [Polaromonas sp.]
MKKLFGILTALVALSAVAEDRMPPIPLDKMTPDQRGPAEEIIKGPRGALYGPFLPLIRSPELMDRSSKMGEYLRYHSAIGNRLSELVILIVARQWSQQVEWYLHESIALKVGIKPDVVKAISEGRRPDDLTADEQIVYAFSSEMNVNHSVSDTTYALAKKRFGEKGVVDMLGLNGYYTYLAIIMNGTQTENPDNAKPLKALIR